MAKRQMIMLTLIQCGRTVWHDDGRLQGSADLPLSGDGRAAMEADLALLMWSHPAIIHHPVDESATETAQMCAKHIGSRHKELKELADPNMGLLEGLTQREFAERFPTRYKQWEEDPLSLSPPEGEEVLRAADRILNSVARLLKRSRGDEVGLVLHEMGLGLMRCWLADRPLTDLRRVMGNRPRIERYAVPIAFIETMETAAAPVHAS